MNNWWGRNKNSIYYTAKWWLVVRSARKVWIMLFFARNNNRPSTFLLLGIFLQNFYTTHKNYSWKYVHSEYTLWVIMHFIVSNFFISATCLRLRLPQISESWYHSKRKRNPMTIKVVATTNPERRLAPIKTVLRLLPLREDGRSLPRHVPEQDPPLNWSNWLTRARMTPIPESRSR